MADLLDLSKQVVDKEGRPTAYLEDIVAGIVLDLGGESAAPVPDQVAMASVLGFVNLAQLKRLRM